MAAYLLQGIPIRELDSNGAPVAGAKLYTWSAGTTSDLATYTDSTGGTPLSNPVVADAEGFYPQIWVSTAAYKLESRKADGVTVLWTKDNVRAPDAALRGELASAASLSMGAGMVGYGIGINYPTDTVGERIRGTPGINVRHFAPPASATDGTYNWTTAINDAVTYATANYQRPKIILPAGHLLCDGLELNSVRGLTFEGESCADPVASNGKTWLYWTAGATADNLLHMISCAYLRFVGIGFYSNGNTGKARMVNFSCNESTAVAPLNKYANTYITFEDCPFLVAAADTMSVATVHVKSSLGVSFIGCPAYGHNAFKLGADTDVDPDTGGATIPDGRAVSTTIRGPLFGNVVLERVLGADIECYFGANSVPFSASDYKVAYWSVSGNQEIRNLNVRNSVCDTANVTHNVNTWFPPITATVAPSGTFSNCQFAGAGTMLDFSSGTWTVQGNKFLAESLPGVTTWRAVRLNAGVEKVSIGPNDYTGLLALNASSVVSTAVEDTRTTQEDRTVLLARGRSTDLTLASTAYTQVLSRTLDYAEGGPVRISYHLTISADIASIFTARLVLDGTDIPGSYSRFTTDSATSQTFVLGISPRRVLLAATAQNATRVLELQVKQETAGPAWATVRGDSYALSDTYAEVEMLA